MTVPPGSGREFSGTARAEHPADLPDRPPPLLAGLARASFGQALEFHCRSMLSSASSTAYPLRSRRRSPHLGPSPTALLLFRGAGSPPWRRCTAPSACPVRPSTTGPASCCARSATPTPRRRPATQGACRHRRRAARPARHLRHRPRPRHSRSGVAAVRLRRLPVLGDGRGPDQGPDPNAGGLRLSAPRHQDRPGEGRTGPVKCGAVATLGALLDLLAAASLTTGPLLHAVASGAASLVWLGWTAVRRTRDAR